MHFSPPAQSDSVKVILTYLIALTFLPAAAYWLEFGNIQAMIELHNPLLVWDLILSVTSAGGIVLAMTYARLLPVVAIAASLFFLWQIGLTFYRLHTLGFDRRMDIEFRLGEFFVGAIVWAVPFLIYWLYRAISQATSLREEA